MGSARAIEPLLVAVLVALVAAGCGSYETGASRASRPVATPTSSSTVPARQLDGAPDTVIYGHIKSLTRKRGRFEMRFDPALWLGGVTAYRAAVEDMHIRPGEPVSNDYYIREESNRLLTYLVPATARLRIITDISAGIRYKRVTPHSWHRSSGARTRSWADTALTASGFAPISIPSARSTSSTSRRHMRP